MSMPEYNAIIDVFVALRSGEPVSDKTVSLFRNTSRKPYLCKAYGEEYRILIHDDVIHEDDIFGLALLTTRTGKTNCLMVDADRHVRVCNKFTRSQCPNLPAEAKELSRLFETVSDAKFSLYNLVRGRI